MLKVITVTNNLERTQPLINSLNKNGWGYHFIECEWRGFGTKLIEVYRYVKSNPEVDEFIFCDAFDVIVLATPEEFKSKLPKSDIVCSAERGIWPDPALEKYYPRVFKHRFNYLNSGSYYAKSEAFIKIMEGDMPQYETDDQLWFTHQFLFNENSGIVLDNKQSIFNSHSFIDEGEYGYENGRIQILGNQPCFIHSNGRTIDEKLNEMICNLPS